MRSARVPLANLQRTISTHQGSSIICRQLCAPNFVASAMVGVMFTCLRRQGGLGLPADVTSRVEHFAMGPTPSAMAVQKELVALPSGLISAARRYAARDAFYRPHPRNISPWVPEESPWTPCLLKHLRHDVGWCHLARFDGEHLEYWLGIAGTNAEDARILEDERELRVRLVYIMEHVHPTLRRRVRRKTSPENIARFGIE